MEERLQKIIARAGAASRRAAEDMITQGRVAVNGVTARLLGIKADPDKDEIRIDGKLIAPRPAKIYLALNKPRGYVTSLRDPEGRRIVADLLTEVPDRLFPVGRLDYDSEGLLLLTNDGDFAYRIEHPRFRISKTYRVKVAGRLTGREVSRLTEGIPLDDGDFQPTGVRVEKINRGSCWLILTVTEGRKRIIRRGFAAIGHPVLRLVRVGIADIRLGELKEGQYRYLAKREVQGLLTARAAKKEETSTPRSR